jgi:hypothetical protein
MKVFLFILVVAAMVGGYYLYENPGVVEPLIEGTPLEGTVGKTQLYKWRDAGGNWQVSDKPPADGVEYEVLEYRHDENIIPSLPEKND